MVTDNRLAISMFESLGEAEQASALEWLRRNQSSITISQGYPRKAPTGPLVAVVPGADSEVEQPIDAFFDNDTVAGVSYEGIWFQSTYRCLCLGMDNADVVTYLSAFVRFTLMRYRKTIEVAGLVEQNLSTSDLMPAPEFEPELVFSRAVVLSGKHVDAYPVVLATTPTLTSSLGTYIGPFGS